VVLGLIFAEWIGFRTESRRILLLSNASYAMYVLHPLILDTLMQYSPQPLRISVWWFAGATIATVAISVGYYLTIEASVIRWLRVKLLGDRPVPVDAALVPNAE
jgi:peptidoglycan/LPS O-acetylase OafA/YrhL